MLDFIPATIAAIFLIVGVLGLASKKLRTIIGSIPVANKLFDPTTWSVAFVVLGLLAGGVGVISSYAGTASFLGGEETGIAIVTAGALNLKLHDGLVNATATQDYYNDDDTLLTFYSTDAAVADGEEFVWNITIERSTAVEAAVYEVSCSIPDKEISGITADNLAEKTAGQIDLDINDGGNHANDNTVTKKVSVAAGTVTTEVEVAFDQEETYHDGMVDLDDYVDATCSVTADDGNSASVNVRIFADS